MVHIFVGDALKLPFLPNLHPFKLIYIDAPYAKLSEQFIYDISWQLVPRLTENSYLLIWTDVKSRYNVEKIFTEYYTGHLKLTNEIVWEYNFGLYTHRRFVPSHDTLLVYKHGSPEFNWTEVCIDSQRLLHGDLRADLHGRVPGDVWHYPRQPGNSLHRRHLEDKHDRTCQPRELLIRIIKAYTKKGNWVFDPFMGTGQLGFVCHTYDRNYIGMDIVEGYVKEIQKKLNGFK